MPCVPHKQMQACLDGAERHGGCNELSVRRFTASHSIPQHVLVQHGGLHMQARLASRSKIMVGPGSHTSRAIVHAALSGVDGWLHS